MGAATERIPVMVTASEKAEIKAKAKGSNLSVGEFMRQAASSFKPPQDEALQARLLDEILVSTARAEAALDDALAFVEASNKRIEALEARRGAR